MSGVLKISLAGANNSVPTTGLTPCIHVIIVAPKNTSTPADIPWCREWRQSANSTPLPILAPRAIRRTNSSISDFSAIRA